MTPQSIALAILVFLVIATRLWEEGRWRAGKLSDRTSAILVVARLPFLVGGFTLITGQPPGLVAAATAAAVLVAAGLYRLVVARLRRLSGRPAPPVRKPD